MKYALTIVNNETGEARVYQDNYDWPDEDHFVFMYTEGNYGCDCNRGLFFDRAAGFEGNQGEDEGDVCGSEKYSIPTASCEDGRVIDIDV